MRRREYENLWDEHRARRLRPDTARDKIRRIVIAFSVVAAMMLAYGFIFWALPPW